jgi:hypothetical protein
MCLLAMLFAVVPSAGAQSLGGCQLNGTANFSPALNNNAQNFSYSFAGSLTGCQSSTSGAPVSGSVEAGRRSTTPYNWTYTDSTGVHSGTATATYQEPIPTGNGSCGSSTTSGTSITNWADGSTTVVSYDTTGATAAVELTGTVIPRVNDTLVSYTGPTQAPPAATHTVSTTRYAGQSALGQLFFQPPDPTACAGAGVTSAAISGVISLGSPQ